MKRHGLDHNGIRWIQKQFSGQNQRVIVNGFISIWEEVSDKLPQGYVLSLVLFNIFNSELNKGIGGMIIRFADANRLGQNPKEHWAESNKIKIQQV